MRELKITNLAALARWITSIGNLLVRHIIRFARNSSVLRFYPVLCEPTLTRDGASQLQSCRKPTIIVTLEPAMSTNLESLYAQKIADLSDVEFSFFQGVVRLLLCQRINLGLSDFRIALKYNVQTARSVGGLGSDPFTNDLERTFNDFVIHDTNTDSWIFVDLSVRSYLENHKDYHPRINHAFVATCCLQYLSSDEVIDSKRPSGEAQAQASHTFLSLFHQYACLYWPLHLSKSEELRSQRPLKELCGMSS